MTRSEIQAALTSTRRRAHHWTAAKIALFTLILAATIPILADAAPAATSGVSIVGFAYSPTPVTVAAGATVVWTNNDQAPHSVTADGGTFDSSPSNCSPSVTSGCLAKAGTFSHTFTTPGTFTYVCRVHTFMHGTVVVTAAVTTTTTPPATTTSTTRPTTTTRPASTTTAVGTTTTVATTTSSVAGGTTSIVSTTLAATSTSATTAPSHAGSSSASPILILLGLLVAGAVIFVLYRRRRLR